MPQNKVDEVVQMVARRFQSRLHDGRWVSVPGELNALISDAEVLSYSGLAADEPFPEKELAVRKQQLAVGACVQPARKTGCCRNCEPRDRLPRDPFDGC